MHVYNAMIYMRIQIEEKENSKLKSTVFLLRIGLASRSACGGGVG